MRFTVLMAVIGGLLAVATAANADQIGALLTGYEESPSVSLLPLRPTRVYGVSGRQLTLWAVIS